MPPPGGPPPQCDGSSVHRDKWQLGLGYGTFKTTIRFDADQEVALQMSTISLSAAWLINDTWSVRGSLGAIVDGTLQPETQATHPVQPGGLAGLGLEYRALAGNEAVPFVDLSLFLGASWTETKAPDSGTTTSYFAADARLGARAGWNVNGNIFPYVAARVFGGPVQWELNGEEITGTDIHHYQLALGAAVQLGRVGVYGEWAGLGEQVLSGGLSAAF